MRHLKILIFSLIALQVREINGARILAVYPFPSVSHQIVFRPLTLELIKRGHEVVVVTADPAFPDGGAPENLKEIDVHDIAYGIWRNEFLNAGAVQGKANDWKEQNKFINVLVVKIFENILLTEEVQNILKHKYGKFDLLIHESFYSAALIFSHVFRIPVIQFSSFGSVLQCLNSIGAPTHPILYPLFTRQRIHNLSFWDKITLFHKFIEEQEVVEELESNSEIMLKKLFGTNIPSLSELKNNVDLLFINLHPIWENNRPSPPNLIYLGGLHQKPEKPLPQDLKNYLDSSKNGVIYISFGTNVDLSKIPQQKLQILLKVLSRLPYDVLWKWNTDELPGKSDNIRISKWFPQSDLLRHPKVKLFITQGGLQSTDEAITAGIPMVGIPMLGDQWYNVEQYVQHGVGVYVNMETITEDIFENSILEVINNESYRQNMLQLRSVIQDQPQTPLERAVWWTEYVIRHKGAKHLKSPAANISWAEYLELELVAYATVFLLSIVTIIALIALKFFKLLTKRSINVKRKLN